MYGSVFWLATWSILVPSLFATFALVGLFFWKPYFLFQSCKRIHILQNLSGCSIWSSLTYAFLKQFLKNRRSYRHSSFFDMASEVFFLLILRTCILNIGLQAGNLIAQGMRMMPHPKRFRKRKAMVNKYIDPKLGEPRTCWFFTNNLDVLTGDYRNKLAYILRIFVIFEKGFFIACFLYNSNRNR